MKAGTEEEIPYDNTDQDDDVVSGKRKPMQTERAEYQRGMLKAQYKSRKASVVKQINVIKGLFQEPDSKPTIAYIREFPRAPRHSEQKQGFRYTKGGTERIVKRH